VGLKEFVAVEEVDTVAEVVVDAEIVPDADCETVPVPQGDALWEPETVPHELTVVDGDAVGETVALTDPLFELVTDDVAEVDNDGDTVDDAERVLDVV
jgi:hypothetical protein